MPLTIGLDLDGCAYPLHDVLRGYLWANGHHGPLPEIRQWDLWNDWGITRDQFLQALVDGCADGVIFHQGNPVDGARDAWRALKVAGHRLVVMTDRPQPGAIAATEGWLRRHDMPFDEVRFGPNKAQPDIDVLVDDAPHHVHARDAVGLLTLLFTRPYNAHMTGTPRAATWAGVVAAIQVLEQSPPAPPRPVACRRCDLVGAS